MAELRRVDFLFAMTGAQGLFGGIASSNRNVLRALAEVADERGGRLTVYSLLENEKDRPDFLPACVGFRAFRRNKRRFAFSLLEAARRRPILCFDHVGLSLPVLPLAAAGLAKTVIFAHGSESWRRLRSLSRWSFRCAALCLTNSHFTLKKMQERMARFNGVDCPLGLSPEFELNDAVPNGSAHPISLRAVDGESYLLGARVLLLVSRMHPAERKKGHYALIRALPAILKEYPDVQIVFAGPGEDRNNIEERARSRGVASAVFLPGFLSNGDLRLLYSRSYAFVMPSLQEGFGLAYLEAMNYGKPCVGCFDQGAEDIIVHGQTGFLVRDPNDTEELCGALRSLLKDPGRARTLGRNGFERLHRFFTSSEYQRRIKEQIRRVL